MFKENNKKKTVVVSLKWQQVKSVWLVQKKTSRHYYKQAYLKPRDKDNKNRDMFWLF